MIFARILRESNVRVKAYLSNERLNLFSEFLDFLANPQAQVTPDNLFKITIPSRNVKPSSASSPDIVTLDLDEAPKGFHKFVLFYGTIFSSMWCGLQSRMITACNKVIESFGADPALPDGFLIGNAIIVL
jgi:hypothetical protein